jgi:hypothetical protein
MGDDPYADLKQHALAPEMLAKVAIGPRKICKRREHFVKVPWTWIERLNGAGGRRTGLLCTCFTCTGKIEASPSNSPTPCYGLMASVVIRNGKPYAIWSTVV